MHHVDLLIFIIWSRSGSLHGPYNHPVPLTILIKPAGVLDVTATSLMN